MALLLLSSSYRLWHLINSNILLFALFNIKSANFDDSKFNFLALGVWEKLWNFKEMQLLKKV